MDYQKLAEGCWELKLDTQLMKEDIAEIKGSVNYLAKVVHKHAGRMDEMVDDIKGIRSDLREAIGALTQFAGQGLIRQEQSIKLLVFNQRYFS